MEATRPLKVQVPEPYSFSSTALNWSVQVTGSKPDSSGGEMDSTPQWEEQHVHMGIGGIVGEGLHRHSTTPRSNQGSRLN